MRVLRNRFFLFGIVAVAAFLVHGLLPASSPQAITVDYPLADSVFPPDLAAPTFLFRDSLNSNRRWKVRVQFEGSEEAIEREIAGEWLKPGPIDYRTIAPTNKLPELMPEQAGTRTWRPEAGVWEEMKRRSAEKTATVTFLGYTDSSATQPSSEGAVRIRTSKDPVGAPVFFRDVPLMPAEQEKGLIRPLPKAALPLVAWRLRYVDETESRTLLTDMPTCANCHSFSKDGKTLGMDLDGPANDKGLYALVPIEKTMTIENKDVVAWSNFRGKLGGKMRVGFMSQVSPDGNYVATMVNGGDFGFEAQESSAPAAGAPALPKDVQGNFYVANFTDYRFLQVFYPTRGILAWYSRETGKLQPVPGADDPEYVHTNVTWSPDGEYLVFARAKARNPYPPGVALAKVANDPNETPIQYDLYRIPFRNGRGGKPEAIEGASNNGKSNSFAKVSPDGKWIVYVQAKNGLLMRPDSELYIVPFEGGTPRRMRCNTPLMNSWHSFSPNGRWLAFSSKSRGPYTKLFLTHIDEQGNDSPAILVENATAANRAVNIPEFVNIGKDEWLRIDTPATEFYSLSDGALEKMQSGDYAAAVEAWKRALAKEPEDVAALSNLGATYDAMGRLEEAAAQFEKALAADRRNYKTQSNLGVALAKLGKVDEGIAHLRESLALYPGEVRTYTALGAVLTNAERLEEARGVLQQALEIDPVSADAHNNLGGVLARQGQYTEAIRHFEKALEAEPNAAVTLYNLGRAVAATGRVAEGIVFVEKADRSAGGQDLTILDRLSTLYAEDGRYREAAGAARRAAGIARQQRNAEAADALAAKAAAWESRN